MRKSKLAVLGVAAVVAGTAAAFSATALGGENDSGFKTSQPAMLTPVAAGVSAEAIMTVGERLASGYTMEAIPDGISLKTRGNGRVDLWLNHETSAVPFPVKGPPSNPTTFFDYTNSLVSHLILNQQSRGVLQGSYAIPSSANYQRFCSNFLAGSEHGFERELLLTNEEATDFVYRTGTAWPVTTGDPAAEQAGVVVAYDIKKKDYRSIYGMGRHNHENAVAIPGYGHPVVLSGDDTFSAPASQLYLYTAPSAEALWNDTYAPGTSYDQDVQQLWAFVADDSADADAIPENDYGDLTTGESVSGAFIPVPEAVAKGGQTGLDNWSNDNNVFQFIRVEDIAYDRNDSNIVYLADTGEPRARPHATDPATNRLTRGSSSFQGPYPNGRIFKLELDPSDPTQVDSLSVLIDGDAGGYYSSSDATQRALWVAAIHQPDNLETTGNSLLIQEDPGSHQQRVASDPDATTARVWLYDLDTNVLTVVVRVDQTQDTTGAKLGVWESSGIVDASVAFGPGAFLVDVQAGTISIDRVEGPDESGPVPGSPPDLKPDTVLEREGGQLLLLRIPGA